MLTYVEAVAVCLCLCLCLWLWRNRAARRSLREKRQLLDEMLADLSRDQEERSVRQPSGIDLELATKPQLLKELTGRPDFAGVVIVPCCTCQGPAGLVVQRVDIVLAGMEEDLAADCAELALQAWRRKRRRS